jgi:hypothetical protein
VTIAKRPSVGRDGWGYRSDLGQVGTGIFLQPQLDRQRACRANQSPVKSEGDLSIELHERSLSFRVIPGRVEDANHDVQLHIGESRDSGFDASHRPGMAVVVSYPLASQAQARITHSLPPNS